MPKCVRCHYRDVPVEGLCCRDCFTENDLTIPNPQPLGQMDRGATGQYCPGITWEDINLKNWVRR